jgi:hypothetical protein
MNPTTTISNTTSAAIDQLVERLLSRLPLIMVFACVVLCRSIGRSMELLRNP